MKVETTFVIWYYWCKRYLWIIMHCVNLKEILVQSIIQFSANIEVCSCMIVHGVLNVDHFLWMKKILLQQTHQDQLNLSYTYTQKKSDILSLDRAACYSSSWWIVPWLFMLEHFVIYVIGLLWAIEFLVELPGCLLDLLELLEVAPCLLHLAVCMPTSAGWVPDYLSSCQLPTCRFSTKSLYVPYYHCIFKSEWIYLRHRISKVEQSLNVLEKSRSYENELMVLFETNSYIVCWLYSFVMPW